VKFRWINLKLKCANTKYIVDTYDGKWHNLHGLKVKFNMAIYVISTIIKFISVLDETKEGHLILLKMYTVIDVLKFKMTLTVKCWPSKLGMLDQIAANWVLLKSGVILWDLSCRMLMVEDIISLVEKNWNVASQLWKCALPLRVRPNIVPHPNQFRIFLM